MRSACWRRSSRTSSAGMPTASAVCSSGTASWCGAGTRCAPTRSLWGKRRDRRCSRQRRVSRALARRHDRIANSDSAIVARIRPDRHRASGEHRSLARRVILTGYDLVVICRAGECVDCAFSKSLGRMPICWHARTAMSPAQTARSRSSRWRGRRRHKRIDLLHAALLVGRITQRLLPALSPALPPRIPAGGCALPLRDCLRHVRRQRHPLMAATDFKIPVESGAWVGDVVKIREAGGVTRMPSVRTFVVTPAG